MIFLFIIVPLVSYFIYNIVLIKMTEKLKKEFHTIHGEVFRKLLDEIRDGEDFSSTARKLEVFSTMTKLENEMTPLIINNKPFKLKRKLKQYKDIYGKYSVTYLSNKRKDKIDKIISE